MIDRDTTLTEEEDFEKNVKPLIRPGQVAEKLFSFPVDAKDFDNLEVVGWWIIDENFYSTLEDDEDTIVPLETEPLL